MISISKITVNGYENSCFAEGRLQFGWQIAGDGRDIRQEAYQIQIGEVEDFSEIVWDTGRTESSASQFVEVTGFAPEHLKKYYVRVMVWDNRGQKSDWHSECSFFYICREQFSWKAWWTAPAAPLAQTQGGLYIRKRFTVKGKIQKAVLTSAAQGIYQPYLDGKRISDELFLPGWTAYENRIQYQIWDITEDLKQGQEHMMGCILAPGWYRGRLGETGRGMYGERIAWIAQIYLYYEDGQTEVILTDQQCRCHQAPLLLADLYDGEIYDARLEIPGWCTPQAKDTGWTSAETEAAEAEKLWPQKVQGVSQHECFEGKELYTPAGEHCIDFGQNMAGLVAFSVKGQPGDKVEFTCFEALDREGNVYTENLRSAGQKIVYYCKGEGEESYMPEFSYQGFRYIHINSWPGEVLADKIKANAVYSDIPFYGTFTSDHPLVNRLMENIKWSMKSNFVDVPTDCPQRDERLGWTGDAQIFSETAVYLANVYGFFEKWLYDVAGEQLEDGGVPHIVPDILRFEDQSGDWLLSQGTHSAAAWADCMVLIPWRLYQYYGNKKILEIFYDNMKRWIDFMWQHSKGYIWNYMLQFGDWLALDAAEGSYFGATPNDLTCTAYFAYSTGIFRKAAEALGKEEDSRIYGQLYQDICNAFCSHFLKLDGMLRINTQTALAMALHFGLLPKEHVQKNAEELRWRIRENGDHMTTGFMGTPCILAALSENGFTEDAYRLFLREEYPSWLYQVKKGATTVWEHLDGMKSDGTMWSSDMNSFNHYAYGAVAGWLFTQAAGIRSLEEAPGFKKFIMNPKLSWKLPQGECRTETPYGETAVSWKFDLPDGWIRFQVPPNAEAEILLGPEVHIKDTDGLQFCEKDGYLRATAGSGIHTITCEINKMQ